MFLVQQDKNEALSDLENCKSELKLMSEGNELLQKELTELKDSQSLLIHEKQSSHAILNDILSILNIVSYH